MVNKEKVIVILLVIALLFSFASLAIHFVTPTQQFNVKGVAGEMAGNIQLTILPPVPNATNPTP